MLCVSVNFQHDMGQKCHINIIGGKLPPLKVCYQANSWDTYAVR